MHSEVWLKGDLAPILAAVYSTKADDPSPYGAGFRRGVLTVALALGLSPAALTERAAIEPLEATEAPKLTVITSQRKALTGGGR
jgi:hypothetical protein